MIIKLRVDSFKPILFGVLGLLALVAAPNLVIDSSGEFNFLMAAIIFLFIIAGVISTAGSLRGDYETELEVAETGLIVYLKNGDKERIEYENVESVEAGHVRFSGEVVTLHLTGDLDNSFQMKDGKTAEIVAAEIQKHLTKFKQKKFTRQS